jgi:hypothetical protein
LPAQNSNISPKTVGGNTVSISSQCTAAAATRSGLGAQRFQEAKSVASVDFPLMADEGSDDLPRTLRREREARERAAREREAKARTATLTHDFGASDGRSERGASAEALSGTAVNRFEVPFGHLMMFFIKAVFAAIPALIILTALLWLGGNVLKAFFPELIHMQILVTFPN